MTSHSAVPVWTSQPTPVDDLLLDSRNPRLTDFGLNEGASQAEILNVLWTKMAVDEVALSIAENGYFQHEPLYAAREGGKLHVVEGNRRLAAVKLLRDAKLRAQIKATRLRTH